MPEPNVTDPSGSITRGSLFADLRDYCAQARPGEVLVSDTVRALVRTRGQLRFASRGTRRLKGIREPVELFAVSRPAEGVAQTPTRPLVARAGRFVASRFGIASLVVIAIVLVGGTALVLSAAVDDLGRADDSSTRPLVALDPTVSPTEARPTTCTDGGVTTRAP